MVPTCHPSLCSMLIRMAARGVGNYKTGGEMRFYFHVINGGARALDQVGEQFSDLRAARDAALLSAREIALDQMRSGQPSFFIAIEIADETGRILDIVTFREALADAGQPTEDDSPALEHRIH